MRHPRIRSTPDIRVIGDRLLPDPTEQGKARQEIEHSRFHLVLGIGLSLDQSLGRSKQPRKPPRVVATIPELRARVEPVLLLESSEDFREDAWYVCRYGRLLIVVEQDEQATRRVRKVADGLQSLFALFFGAPAPHRILTCSVPERLVKSGAIEIIALEAVERTAARHFDVLTFRGEVRTAVYTSERTMAHVFFYLPTICCRDELFDASHFYEESISDFQFLGDDVREVLDDPGGRPVSKENQVKLESAVLNSFRAVEAVIGEPGKREVRFRQRLITAGIDPDQQVGYSGDANQPIRERIRWLNELRDATSAHGRRRRTTPLTYREVMEAQDIAKAVVLQALVHATSEHGRLGRLPERRYLTSQIFGTVRPMGQQRRTMAIAELVAIPGGLERVVSALDGRDST